MSDQDPRNLTRVANRRVVHISGFEPVAVDVLDRRMKNGVRRYGKLWSAKAKCSPPEISEDEQSVSWEIRSGASSWKTTCRYTVLRWDDIMARYTGRSWVGRIFHGYKALFEFIWTGTLRRYFAANPRYGVFFVYPLLALAGFLLLGVVGGVVAGLFGIPVIGAILIGVLVFILAMRFIGAWFYMDFALADWAFAADLARRDVPGLEEKVDAFSATVVEALRDPDADEVLLSGVSLGAVMLVEALARAFRSNPDLETAARHAVFLTVGSSIMKIGLHPAAETLRRDVDQIGSEKSLLWVEYQARVDPINFFGTNPVTDLGGKATGSPIVREIRIRDMMSAEAYRRAQRNTLYLHRQFVMPNAKRYFYDFYHISFGPLLMVERLPLGRRVPYVFADDGRLKWRGRRKEPLSVETS